MVKVLVDTCVWIDLAKDHKNSHLLSVIQQLIENNLLALVVPELVIEEFQRNKQRIIEDNRKSLSSVFKRVKDAVEKFGEPRSINKVINHLNDVNHRLPLLGENIVDSIEIIESLFSHSKTIATTESVILRAAQRGIDKIAPFHLSKNSINDAILIEIYRDLIKEGEPRERFMFITHNKDDFSQPIGNKKEPHPDIAKLFSPRKSRYFINLAEAVHQVAPKVVSRLKKEYDWSIEPRSLSEMIEAEDALTDKIWYDRHQLWLRQIETGKHKIVSGKDYVYNPKETPRYIYNAARKNARRVEKQYGIKNLGPYSDFDWGMLNGKLSAIRWVLGDEWDVLDA